MAAVDCRSERSRECIAEPPTWAALFEKIGALPASMRHLVLLLPTPPHWPKARAASCALHLCAASWRKAAAGGRV